MAESLNFVFFKHSKNICYRLLVENWNIECRDWVVNS